MIRFINIRTGEEKEAVTEPMISAYYNSSDRNVNGIVQDYGWRIAPEYIKQIMDIQRNKRRLQEVADDIGILKENVKETDILFWISAQDDHEEEERDYDLEQKLTRDYEDQIRALEDGDSAPSTTSDDKELQAAQAKRKKAEEDALKAAGEQKKKEYEEAQAAKKAEKEAKAAEAKAKKEADKKAADDAKNLEKADKSSTTSDSGVESEGGKDNSTEE